MNIGNISILLSLLYIAHTTSLIAMEPEYLPEPMEIKTREEEQLIEEYEKMLQDIARAQEKKEEEALATIKRGFVESEEEKEIERPSKRQKIARGKEKIEEGEQEAAEEKGPIAEPITVLTIDKKEIEIPANIVVRLKTLTDMLEGGFAASETIPVIFDAKDINYFITLIQEGIRHSTDNQGYINWIRLQLFITPPEEIIRQLQIADYFNDPLSIKAYTEILAAYIKENMTKNTEYVRTLINEISPDLHGQIKDVLLPFPELYRMVVGYNMDKIKHRKPLYEYGRNKRGIRRNITFGSITSDRYITLEPQKASSKEKKSKEITLWFLDTDTEKKYRHTYQLGSFAKNLGFQTLCSDNGYAVIYTKQHIVEEELKKDHHLYLDRINNTTGNHLLALTHQLDIRDVQFIPSKNAVAIITVQKESPPEEKIEKFIITINIYSCENGSLLFTKDYSHEGDILDIKLSQDGDFLYVSSRNFFSILNIETEKKFSRDRIISIFNPMMTPKIWTVYFEKKEMVG
jgi:hypothetical protein